MKWTYDPFDNDWDLRQTGMWYDICCSLRAPGSPFSWYRGGAASGKVRDDYEAALKDAKAGDERAKRYIAEFIKIRMQRS